MSRPLRKKAIFRIEDQYRKVIPKTKKIIRKGDIITLNFVKEKKGKWGCLNNKITKETEQTNICDDSVEYLIVDHSPVPSPMSHVNKSHISDLTDKSYIIDNINESTIAYKDDNLKKAMVNGFSHKTPKRMDNIIGKYGHLPIFRKLGNNLTPNGMYSKIKNGGGSNIEKKSSGKSQKGSTISTNFKIQVSEYSGPHNNDKQKTKKTVISKEKKSEKLAKNSHLQNKSVIINANPQSKNSHVRVASQLQNSKKKVKEKKIAKQSRENSLPSAMNNLEAHNDNTDQDLCNDKTQRSDKRRNKSMNISKTTNQNYQMHLQQQQQNEEEIMLEQLIDTNNNVNMNNQDLSSQKGQRQIRERTNSKIYDGGSRNGLDTDRGSIDYNFNDQIQFLTNSNLNAHYFDNTDNDYDEQPCFGVGVVNKPTNDNKTSKSCKSASMTNTKKTYQKNIPENNNNKSNQVTQGNKNQKVPKLPSVANREINSGKGGENFIHTDRSSNRQPLSKNKVSENNNKKDNAKFQLAGQAKKVHKNTSASHRNYARNLKEKQQKPTNGCLANPMIVIDNKSETALTHKDAKDSGSVEVTPNQQYRNLTNSTANPKKVIYHKRTSKPNKNDLSNTNPHMQKLNSQNPKQSQNKNTITAGLKNEKNANEPKLKKGSSLLNDDNNISDNDFIKDEKLALKPNPHKCPKQQTQKTTKYQYEESTLTEQLNYNIIGKENIINGQIQCSQTSKTRTSRNFKNTGKNQLTSQPESNSSNPFIQIDTSDQTENTDDIFNNQNIFGKMLNPKTYNSKKQKNNSNFKFAKSRSNSSLKDDKLNSLNSMPRNRSLVAAPIFQNIDHHTKRISELNDHLNDMKEQYISMGRKKASEIIKENLMEKGRPKSSRFDKRKSQGEFVEMCLEDEEQKGEPNPQTQILQPVSQGGDHEKEIYNTEVSGALSNQVTNTCGHLVDFCGDKKTDELNSNDQFVVVTNGKRLGNTGQNNDKNSGTSLTENSIYDDYIKREERNKSRRDSDDHQQNNFNATNNNVKFFNGVDNSSKRLYPYVQSDKDSSSGENSKGLGSGVDNYVEKNSEGMKIIDKEEIAGGELSGIRLSSIIDESEIENEYRRQLEYKENIEMELKAKKAKFGKLFKDKQKSLALHNRFKNYGYFFQAKTFLEVKMETIPAIQQF